MAPSSSVTSLRLDGRAGAGQAAVAVDVVDVIHRRQYLPPPGWPADRRPVMAVGVVPSAEQFGGGVRRVLQRVVFLSSSSRSTAISRGCGSSRRRNDPVRPRLAFAGSIISVPATGKDMVGAWKPKSNRRWPRRRRDPAVLSDAGRGCIRGRPGHCRRRRAPGSASRRWAM